MLDLCPWELYEQPAEDDVWHKKAAFIDLVGATGACGLQQYVPNLWILHEFDPDSFGRESVQLAERTVLYCTVETTLILVVYNCTVMRLSFIVHNRCPGKIRIHVIKCDTSCADLFALLLFFGWFTKLTSQRYSTHTSG